MEQNSLLDSGFITIFRSLFLCGARYRLACELAGIKCVVSSEWRDKSSSRPTFRAGTGVVPARMLNGSLEVELSGEFNLTWAVDCSRDRSSAQFAEIGVGRVCADISELRVIQEVGCIDAKLEAKAFGEVEILAQTCCHRVGGGISDIAKRLRIKSVANGEIVINAVIKVVLDVGGSRYIVVTRQ